MENTTSHNEGKVATAVQEQPGNSIVFVFVGFIRLMDISLTLKLLRNKHSALL
jgi:hypothetical protein